MDIIGSLIAVLIYWLTVDTFGGDSRDLTLIKNNLGEEVKYLGKDRSKRKFVFAMPYGKKVETEKIQEILSSFLGKYVEVSFDKYLYVQVFDTKLKRKYPLIDAEKSNKKVRLGIGYTGEIYHNFIKYPHMVVAGHTGYGKTELIKSIIPQLDGEVVLIDMKPGESTYPIVSAGNVLEALSCLEQVVSNFGKNREHVFVIIDEAAQLLPPDFLKSKEEKMPYLKCQKYIHDIASMGRSLKVHLIFATQYPTANVIPGWVKQNCETRVVFRLPTKVASGVALDEEGAENLPAGLPGRAIYKNDSKMMMQSYIYKGGFEDVKIRGSKKERIRDSFYIG